MSDVANRLQLALQAEGSSLAPLTEANDFVLPAMPLARVSGQPITELNMKEEKNHTDNLTMTAMPNPSRTYFTLKIQSNSKEVVQLRVLDLSGRIVETRNGMVPNTTFHIGNNFQAGIYLVEVTQGKQRQILKLIKQ